MFSLILPIDKANKDILPSATQIKDVIFLLLLPYDSAKLEHTFVQSARVTCTKKSLNTMKKKLPILATDKEAEDFIENADLTEYDLSALIPIRFEFQPKERSITMRLSEPLLDAIKEQAWRSGIPYQRFIRQALENAVHHKS
jgi:predicted DNA binding CopG/RHH family protein